MSERSVVLLAGPGVSTRIVYHALKARLPREFPLHVIVERPVPAHQILRRRVKRLGLVTVFGQLLFLALVVPLLRIFGQRRVASIKTEHALDDAPLMFAYEVPSANARQTQVLLRSLVPTVVVVNGTRILSPVTLRSTPAPFINMHAGITPTFRGVHGGYWALAEGRPDMVGTTIHLVDEGIDTGAIIDQSIFAVTGEDSFYTYPYLHTAFGLPPLLRAVEAALNEGVKTRSATGASVSALRSHPTVWGYLARRLCRGVR